MVVGNIYLPKGRTHRGVYKFTIDDKWFYVGSSTDLGKRIGKWRGYLKRKQGFNNRNIKKVLTGQSVIKFKILRKCKLTEPVKPFEDAYLKKWFHNPNCLNRCPSAFSSKGVRPPMGETAKPKYISKGGTWPSPKGVARFDMDWNYIDQTRTITEMAAILGCSRPSDFTSKISDVIRGKVKYYKGYKFKFINPDGSFQDIKPFVSKETRIKPLLQIDATGKIVNKFNGISEAVRLTGACRSSICKILYGIDNRKTTGGYKYAYEK